jgi:hypothetical protein
MCEFMLIPFYVQGNYRVVIGEVWDNRYEVLQLLGKVSGFVPFPQTPTIPTNSHFSL